VYDPALDRNPIKKGKAVVHRWDGEGVPDEPEDPRPGAPVVKVDPKKVKKAQLMHKVSVISYNVRPLRPLSSRRPGRNQLTPPFLLLASQWDRNSLGPPPPAPPTAIFVSGFPSATGSDAINAHFRAFGQIETQDFKHDPQTGGNLGLCWIKFADDIPHDVTPDQPTRERYERKKREGRVQNGAEVAARAVREGNGARVGMAMLRSTEGVKVVLDRDGKLCNAAYKAELARRHPPKPKPAAPPPAAPAAGAASPLPAPTVDSAPPSSPRAAPTLPPVSSIPGLPAKPVFLSDKPPSPLPPAVPPPPPPSRNPLPPQQSAFRPPALPDAAPGAPPSASRIAVPSMVVPPLPTAAQGAPPSAMRISVPSMVVPPLPARRPPAAPVQRERDRDRERERARDRDDRDRDLDRWGRPIRGGRGSARESASGSGGGGGRASGGKRGDNMASAIAQAVAEAKKRLKAQQEAQARARNGEEDMEMSSADEDEAPLVVGGTGRASGSAQGRRTREGEGDEKGTDGSDEAGGDEDDEDDDGGASDSTSSKDAFFFSRATGRLAPRRTLPRGIAPVGAIAWQVSKKVLVDKLVDNGRPYLLIEKASFERHRLAQGGRMAVPNHDELKRHFRDYEIDRVRPLPLHLLYARLDSS